MLPLEVRELSPHTWYVAQGAGGKGRPSAGKPGWPTQGATRGTVAGAGECVVSPEVGTGLLAKAAAQASLGAGRCGAAQGSELLEAECVLAAGATPHGSTEAAGWAPVGRQGRAHRCPQKVLGSWGEKGKDTVGHVCPVLGEAAPQRVLSHSGKAAQS